MHGLRTTRALVCTLCLATAATSVGGLAAPAPQAVFVQPQHAGDPVHCNDAYYHYLPGILNFCLGVHDWQSGRYRNAIGWLKLAAGWGSKGAQYMLGLMYYDGDHVAADRPLGIAWLELADERHNNKQIELVTRSAVKDATAAERQRADALLRKLRPRYGDKVAAARAWKQFKHYGELVAYELGGGLGGSGSGGCVFMPAGQAGATGQPLPAQAPLPPSQRLTHPGSVTGETCTPVGKFNAGARILANHYFAGWEGHVTVGPLHTVRTASKPAH